MVNQSALDATFHSLADPIRRDMLHRLRGYELSVGELAQKYDVSLVAISKHLNVLERARLVRRRREGRRQMITIVPGAMNDADKYLQQYQQMWQSRYDKLDALLKEGE